MRRDRVMAAGALVVLVMSFRPWFRSRLYVPSVNEVWVHSRNAWLASSRWSAAIAAGLIATAVWFGAVRALPGRTRALAAVALLVVAVGLIGQQWWEMHDSGGPPVTIKVITMANRDGLDAREGLPPQIRRIGTITRDRLAVRHHEGFTADVTPAHYIAWAALLTMLLVATTDLVRAPGGEP